MEVSLKMNRHLKERLTGAATLILLGVWLIPVFLNGEGKNSSLINSIPIPLQQQGSQLATRTIILNSDSVMTLEKNSNWQVQLGVFTDEVLAQTQREDVLNKGFNPEIFNYEVNGSSFYRVLINSSSKDQADSILAQLLLLGLDAQVVENN
tara:strand:- start:11107 stop:11559 length:453 start_codon:yes stop_codon:yes gene_type:complete